MIVAGNDALDGRSGFLQSLRDVAIDVVRHRELLVELTRRDLQIRYKQATMGILWAVITPLVVVLAGALVRFAFAKAAGQSVSHEQLSGLAIKSLGWSFFVGALAFGTNSLTVNLALVTKVYFPRELLPASAVLTQAIDSGIGLLALALILPIVGVGSFVGLLWCTLLAVLLICLTMGAALIASCANVYFRDAKHVIGLITSFGIFFTPVFYDLDGFASRGVRLLLLNPITPLLEGARISMVLSHDLSVPLSGANGALLWSPWYLAYSAAWAIIALAVSAVIFRRAEANFAEYV